MEAPLAADASPMALRPDPGNRRLFSRLGRPAKVLLLAVFVVAPTLMGIGYYHLNPAHSDFMLYYRDARVGWLFGWSHLYDLHDFDIITRQLQIHSTDPNAGALDLPLLTWLAAPFALLPMPQAYVAWFVILLGALIGAWRVAAPGEPRGKAAQLALAGLFLPLVFALALGSAVVLALAALAVCWWLGRQERPLLAGFVLSLTLVRPQVAVLVPVCLLMAGRRRFFVGFLMGGWMIALTALVTIPLPAIEGYLRTMVEVTRHPGSWQVARDLTVMSLRPWPVAATAAVTIAGVVLASSYFARRSAERDSVAITAGVLGSLLVTPYIHLQDLSLLLLVGWLARRALPASWWPALMLVLVATANFDLSIHTALPTFLEAALVLALAATYWPRRQAAQGLALVA